MAIKEKVKANVKSINRLKPREIRYDTSVEGQPGFVVRVRPTGRKVFLHRFKVRGESFRLSLGEVSAVSLADALLDYQKQRNALSRGENPAAEHQREAKSKHEAVTVKALAARYLAEYARPQKRTASVDEMILRRDVLPRWGKLEARSITYIDVDSLISNIRTDLTRGKTAPRKALAVTRKMFAWAVKKHLIPLNPARGIDLPPPPAPRERALSDAELRTFIRRLPLASMPTSMRDALRLQLLTATRIGEVLGLRFSEIDAHAKVWCLPAERSKNRLPHIIPLTAPALILIERLRRRAKGSGFVFPGYGKKGCIRVDSIGHALKQSLPVFKSKDGQSIAPFTTHDLRRTCETGLARLGVGREIRDRVLNHKDASVSGTHYNKHDYLDEKRQALELWAAKLRRVGLSGKSVVIPILAAKKSGNRR